MGLRTIVKRNFGSLMHLLTSGTNVKWELQRLFYFPRFKVGYARVFNRPFKFQDGRSFAVTYREIFQDEIYRFKPSGSSKVILDCGANMGLSVLYFALNYPDHQIIAFEPEEEIFDILSENVKTFGLRNVTLHKKAVWNKEEILRFYTDGGMGGRVNTAYAGQNFREIEAVPLLDYLDAQVDFLKIDIEGAEDVVLRYCENHLHKANHIFFEYHNNVNTDQTLHELLLILRKEGFHYYIKESGVRKRPFVDNDLICETFDMAINIFCYKEARITEHSLRR